MIKDSSGPNHESAQRAEEVMEHSTPEPIKTGEFVQFRGLTLFVLMGLPLAYLCLDVADALRPWRRIVFWPIFGFIRVVREVFGLHFSSSDCFFIRNLTDGVSIGITLYRTFVFGLITVALTLPWFVWLRARKCKYLVLGIMLLILYIEFGVHFYSFLSGITVLTN